MRDNQRHVLVPVRWPVGGIRTYILYNYPLLARAGYRFTFVGPADDSFRRLQSELESWEGNRFVEAPLAGYKCKLRSTVRRLLRKDRFCLVHSHGLTAGLQAVLANTGIGVPHIVTSHDVVRPDQFSGVLGPSKRRLLGLSLRRADLLITVTEDARANHLQFFPGLDRGPCRVVSILHGVDTVSFSKRPADTPVSLRMQYGIDQDVFLIGFLGRFMEQKGFLILIDALDQLLKHGAPKPFHLLAVGSDDYVREYQAEVARRSRLAGHITFTEHVPDVAPILHQLDLVVMPSLWEACGLLAMEAMAAGVPVLGADCPGLREVLRDTPSKMALTGDPVAWADSLHSAIVSPWKSRARAFGSIARDRFAITRPAERLREFFDEFAEPRAQESRRIR